MEGEQRRKPAVFDRCTTQTDGMTRRSMQLDVHHGLPDSRHGGGLALSECRVDRGPGRGDDETRHVDRSNTRRSRASEKRSSNGTGRSRPGRSTWPPRPSCVSPIRSRLRRTAYRSRDSSGGDQPSPPARSEWELEHEPVVRQRHAEWQHGTGLGVGKVVTHVGEIGLAGTNPHRGIDRLAQ